MQSSVTYGVGGTAARRACRRSSMPCLLCLDIDLARAAEVSQPLAGCRGAAASPADTAGAAHMAAASLARPNVCMPLAAAGVNDSRGQASAGTGSPPGTPASRGVRVDDTPRRARARHGRARDHVLTEEVDWLSEDQARSVQLCRWPESKPTS